ncbi:MAG: ald 5 [Nocardia sp.]|uniref:aldehyde dehydrogenase family protein n=1 Tax=Nocardia sp. TaxID=1821 RepID=UPI0026251789|nr:aldehyde dehydrogenase family protein [Nocardia sp.]MCU1644360.1 ald 5 [Nocardia sp.]
MTETTHHMLIDGELVAASDGAVFDNINPATEEVIGSVPNADSNDVERAILAARRAFDTTNWSTDTALRQECLSQLQEILRKNLEMLRPAVVAETGTPVLLTRMTQLDVAVESVGHYIDLLDTYSFERPMPAGPHGPASQRVIRREAAGVVSAITPWNYPLYLNLCKMSAALAAGCTVVLKPAPDTPFSGTMLAELIAEHTAFPPGVINILTTDQTSVAEAMVTHPAVDAVTFTGSTETGRRIMAGAAPTVKRVTLELGGKSAAIVLDDADLKQVVPGIVGAICSHAGQGCALNSRLLVPRSQLGAALEIAKAAMAAMPWGDPQDPANLMGPLISERQLERVLGYFELGASEGRIVTGGRRSDRFERGFFVEPTIITDVAPEARVAQEEIFGPALVVLPYDDEDDAVRIANGTIFGLSGAVFSRDIERAMAVARRLRTGTVGVNGAQWFHASTPFGGYKQSGLGREWGTEGLEDFLELKAIAYP